MEPTNQEPDLTTPEGLAAHMGQTTDPEDWDRRADEVLKANGNQYPSFWWAVTQTSGLYQRVLPGSGLGLVTIDRDGNETSRTTYDPATGKKIS